VRPVIKYKRRPTSKVQFVNTPTTIAMFTSNTIRAARLSTRSTALVRFSRGAADLFADYEHLSSLLLPARMPRIIPHHLHPQVNLHPTPKRRTSQIIPSCMVLLAWLQRVVPTCTSRTQTRLRTSEIRRRKKRPIWKGGHRKPLILPNPAQEVFWARVRISITKLR